ncbi:MAG: hypothetical protein FWB78_06605 [Treponema sp.]|nr:hypothetical protein [Treponema sp.]
MKKMFGKTATLIVLTALALALVGCATRVRFEAQRPPNLNMVGIRRVAVMPFTTNISGAAQVAQHLTSETTQRINATGVFEPLVSYDIVVRPAMQRGAAVDQYVDALFRGRVTHFASSRGTTQRVRRVNNQNVTFTYQTLEVELSFEYEFVNPITGAITGPVRRSGRNSAMAESTGDLPTPESLAVGIANAQLRNFAQDIAPFTIRIARVMQNVGRNDPLRPAFDAADNMRRHGDYLGAREAFANIANENRSIPAAINAGILFEATGDLEDGIFFLEQIFEQTRAPAVAQKIRTLNNEVNALLGIAALAEAGTPVEMVTSHTLSEIRGVVGTDARLWIHNDAGNLAIVNDVVDNITSAFINAGITIVDRGALDLIAVERGLHLDGAVADSDFISLGNMAGADTIVRLNVVGAGSGRRLQVRVLDIERATVVYQSNTSVLWRL